MPNRKELSRAYQAGYNCALDGANINNCHFSLFNSRETTKQWEAGNQDAISKILDLQADIDKLGQT